MGGATPAARARLIEDLEARFAEPAARCDRMLADHADQIVEMEDRRDFAERLLARQEQRRGRGAALAGYRRDVRPPQRVPPEDHLSHHRARS